MEEKRATPNAKAKPAAMADVDATEKGPPRLYAPGKPHEVEAGASRLVFMPAAQQQTTGVRSPSAGRYEASETVDATEGGPARIVRFRQ